MTEFDINSSDPMFKASLLTFVLGFTFTHLVEFHDVVEVILDVVLVGVGFVSIVNGIFKIIDKIKAWKKKKQG